MFSACSEQQKKLKPHVCSFKHPVDMVQYLHSIGVVFLATNTAALVSDLKLKL